MLTRSESSTRALLVMKAINDGMAASSCASTDNADGAGSSKLSDAAGGAVAELPLHLTEHILCCISPLESARHAAVCKSWAATVSARLARPVPHLFMCMAPSIKSDHRGIVVSVPLDGARSSSGKIPSRVRASDTNGLRCIGATPSGRVAFASCWWSSNVILVNPVTGALQGIDVGLSRVDPRQGRVLAAGAAGDSLFAVDLTALTLWRRAQGGGAWSGCEVTTTLHLTNNIVSAVDCNGCFYLLHQDGCLSKVDATVPPPLSMEKLPMASLADQFGYGRLLESDGEVLFVRQLPAYKEELTIDEPDTSLSVAGFEVHRLDVKEQRWTKVNTLPADRALFVSPGSSFAVRASEVEGCRGNCIYFAGEKRNYDDSNAMRRENGESSWGVYCMEDRRVLFEHVVGSDEPERGVEAMWFLPRVV